MSAEKYPHQNVLEAEGSSDQGNPSNPWDLTELANKLQQEEKSDQQQQHPQGLTPQQMQLEFEVMKRQLLEECNTEIQRVKHLHDDQLTRPTTRYDEHILALKNSIQQYVVELDNVKEEAGALGLQNMRLKSNIKELEQQLVKAQQQVFSLQR